MKSIMGISFPFRVGGKGGVVTTKADLNDATHLAESLEQILATSVGERVMEDTGSRVSHSVFDPTSEATYTLLKYEIVEAISTFEKRVSVSAEDIELSGEDNKIFIVVNFLVIDTQQINTIEVEIGG